MMLRDLKQPKTALQVPLIFSAARMKMQRTGQKMISMQAQAPGSF
jgi:hypothetical protein